MSMRLIAHGYHLIQMILMFNCVLGCNGAIAARQSCTLQHRSWINLLLHLCELAHTYCNQNLQIQYCETYLGKVRTQIFP